MNTRSISFMISHCLMLAGLGVAIPMAAYAQPEVNGPFLILVGCINRLQIEFWLRNSGL